MWILLTFKAYITFNELFFWLIGHHSQLQLHSIWWLNVTFEFICIILCCISFLITLFVFYVTLANDFDEGLYLFKQYYWTSSLIDRITLPFWTMTNIVIKLMQTRKIQKQRVICAIKSNSLNLLLNKLVYISVLQNLYFLVQYLH